MRISLIFFLRFLFCLVCIAFRQSGISQDYNSNAYTILDGLPNNNVTCLVQDKQGYLWVGTTNGLSRFDGTHFYHFPQGLLKSDKLAGDLILDIEEEGEYVWVGHRFGLTRINKYTFICENFQSPDTGSAYRLERAIRDIWKDPAGNLWLAGNILYQFDRTKNRIIKKAEPGRPSNQVNKILSQNESKLLLNTPSGWLTYDIVNNRLDSVLRPDIPVALLRGMNLRLKSFWNTFPSNYRVFYDSASKSMSITTSRRKEDGIVGVRNIYVDSALNLILNLEKDQIAIWTHDNKLLFDQLPDNYLKSGGFTQFNYGYIIGDLLCWGTPQGLFIADESRRNSKRYQLSKQVKNDFNILTQINAIAPDGDKNLLIATRNGLFNIDKTNGSLKIFPQWKDSVIHELLITPDRSVWLSTGNYLYKYNPETDRIQRHFYLESYAVALQYFNEKLLVATRSDGFLLIRERDHSITKIKARDSIKQITSNRITDILPFGSPGNFIVTYNDGIGYSYNNFENGDYQPQTIPAEASTFKEKFAIVSVLRQNRQLWFGQYIGGVSMFDSTSSSWNNFTRQSGLSSNYIDKLIADPQGRIWILTDNGVDIYDPVTKQISRFPMSGWKGNKSGGFITADGLMTIFDNYSIIGLNTTLFKTIADKKKVIFGQIIRDKEMVPLLGNNLNFPYKQNSFSIIFSLLKFNPEQVTRYSYRLKKTEEWTEIGTETKLSFASLEPGKYQLQIRATDEFGQWSHFSDTLSISIRPPFGRTVIFWILVGGLIALLLRQLYNYRVRQLKRVYELRQKISRDFHDELGATLSGIKVFSELARDRPETGPLYLDKINMYSEDMLNKMSDIVWTINPENDSFEHMMTKLHSYAASITAAKNIQLHFNVDETIKKKPLEMELRKNIYLIIKEAINNAIKYAGSNNINVNLSLEQKNGVLLVTDDGKGFSLNTTTSGNGLINMKRRAEEINGILEIESRPQSGTSVKLYFNLS